MFIPHRVLVSPPLSLSGPIARQGLRVLSSPYLTLRARTFPVVLGLTLLAYGVNLFLFAMGRLTIGYPAIIDSAATAYSDPLPQALVLTAIVIAFGMTAFLIVLALKARGELGNDHVDGLHLAKDELPPEPNRKKTPLKPDYQGDGQ